MPIGGDSVSNNRRAVVGLQSDSHPLEIKRIRQAPPVGRAEAIVVNGVPCGSRRKVGWSTGGCSCCWSKTKNVLLAELRVTVFIRPIPRPDIFAGLRIDDVDHIPYAQ